MSFLDRPIPIFPLPNCVLFPRAPQCLHVFEPRYREMVADELARSPSNRYIAMALLKPGYELSYCTHQAPIHSTLCIGTITKQQRLVDGRYNILVVGKSRAMVTQECFDRSYRRGVMQACKSVNDLEPEDQATLLGQLQECLDRLTDPLKEIAADIAEHECDLECLVDLLAFHLLSQEAAPAKQMILAEPRVDFRIKMLVTLIQRQLVSAQAVDDLSGWPPSCGEN